MRKLAVHVTFKDPENAPEIPEGSEVILQIRDTARACGPAVLVGKSKYTGASKFPLDYTVDYEVPRPGSNTEYSVSCSIKKDNKLLFINDTQFNICDRIDRRKYLEKIEIFVIKVK